jgi:hypothetical protein
MNSILRLDNWKIKQIRRDFNLKTMLGRGVFSAVFESDNPDTVLKLTVCEVQYQMLRDYTGLDHEMFPLFIRDYGSVGEFVHPESGERHSVYLMEVEKLYSMRGTNKALPRLINKLVCDNYSDDTGLRFSKVGVKLLEMGSAYEKVSEAMFELARFIQDYGLESVVAVDTHGGNFMRRKCGALVINDPLCNGKMLSSHINIIRQRKAVTVQNKQRAL